MFEFLRPLRFSRAGVWIAPQATTTARDFTVSTLPSAETAVTPTARPFSTVTVRARAPT